jgi:hypothetical protein
MLCILPEALRPPLVWPQLNKETFIKMRMQMLPGEG